MGEPSQRSSRIALALGVALAAVSGIAGYRVGLEGAEPTPAALPATPPPAAAPALRDAGPLGRREILDLVAQAADAFATGQPLPVAAGDAIGRRLELRIPFGCFGPSPQGSAAPLRWTYDAKDSVLRVSVTPEIVGGPRERPDLDDAGIESIEGFWLPRPWTASEACPPPALGLAVAPILPTPQRTVGIVQVFEAGSPRTGRRQGKPLEAVTKVEGDDLRVRAGFRLVLTGRLAAFDGGRPVQCRAPTADLRPVCQVAVEIDRYAIENGQTGDVLATWAT